MREPKNQMLGTMEPPLMQLSVNSHKVKIHIVRKLIEESPTPENIHLKIRRRLDVESTPTLEEGEFKVSFDGCINFNTFSSHKWVFP